jgi:tRNA-dihydrouridine synthase
MPIFGNGDAYDYRSYYQKMEESGVDGIMIARGALVKVRLPPPPHPSPTNSRPTALDLHRDQRATRLGYLSSRTSRHDRYPRFVRPRTLG